MSSGNSFANLVTGRVSLSDGVGFIGNPFGTEANMRRAAKEQKQENKERRKQAQEERKAAIKNVKKKQGNMVKQKLA